MLAIEDLFRQPVTNIAFMGMGEPLMNLGAVLDAHRTLNKVCIDPIVIPGFRKAHLFIETWYQLVPVMFQECVPFYIFKF